MKQRRIPTFVLAGVLGLATGVPMRSLADDTEIYTGGSAIEGVKPNILLILDTSGSMSAFDGEAKDRLDRMKDAVTTLLDGVDNVNMGLMRFTDPGGPILFPVKAIDSDADAVAASGQPDVSVRISHDDDDAEELVDDTTPGDPRQDEVKLDSLYLELLYAPAFGTEAQHVVRVGNDNDDADQAVGSYGNGFNELRMGPSFVGGNPFTIGMNFENLPDNTDGATVMNAQITFTLDKDRSGDNDAKIFGYYGWDTHPNFSDSANGVGGCPGLPAPPGGLTAQDSYCLLGLDDTQYAAGINYTNVDSLARSEPVTGRRVTDAIVTWDDVPDGVRDQEIRSPNIAPVLQEIFAHPFWQAAGGDDDLSLFATTTTTSSYRDFYSDDADRGLEPELSVDYVLSGHSEGRQLVGLRFRNVLLPSFAVIESAHLEFTPAGDSADAMAIRISAEKVADAAPFTATNGSLSARLAAQRTTATETWTVPATEVWRDDSAVQSVDISSILKELVAQGGWCGGNDIVFFLEYDAPPGTPFTRLVHSHDGNSSKAPALHVDYDKTDFAAGEGCTTDTVVRRVAADRDDAEEFPTFGGFVQLTSNTLETPFVSGFETASGAIFRSVNIPPGATVTNAAVEFNTSVAESANSSSLLVQGALLTGTIDEFAAAAYDVTSRTNGVAGTAGVTVTVPPTGVSANEPFRSPNIGPVIQALINQPTWEQGDDMLLTFRAGTGQLEIKSHDSDPARAMALVVDIQYNVGDVIGTLPAGVAPGITTVRQRLKEIVQGFNHSGFTPIVDTLYEAGRYYRGEGVVYGASRGDGGGTVERNTRLSHIGSYTGGSVDYPNGCNTDDSNLSDEACRDQRITGSPVYDSPIEESCQANFIVLLTDGQANHNHSQQRIRDMTGANPCQTTFSDTSTVAGGEECGVDLAKFLFDNDQSTDVAGKNNISTYTIGFNFSGQFLRDLAAVSEGTFSTAGTEAELLETFRAIIADVLSRATSFAAPSLSVNAFNRLEDRNEVYFSLFEPAPNVSWIGNIKKFQLCQSDDEPCFTVSGAEVGEVVDSRDPPAIAVAADGRILDTALSFWSTAPDGPEVLKGGTGEQLHLLGHENRRVFTMSADADQAGPPPESTVTFYPSSVDLGALENRLIDADGDGVLDGLTGTAAQKEAQTRALLSMGTATLGEISDQINWIRGKDVDSRFDDLVYGEDRWAFGDPLHGNPLALTYGGTEDEPIIKLLAGTNDGGIRMINANNGKEEWVFFPSEMLPPQQDMRTNAVAAQRIYGVDGTATPWIRDTGQIGVIEPGLTAPLQPDFVRVFLGARRGGNFYYGLDITPTATIAKSEIDALDKVTPKVMWRIRGGTPQYPMLGQTWSRPIRGRMLYGNDQNTQAELRDVIIFAGGYEPTSQDAGAFGKSNPTTGVGNAIYVADALTGERLFFVGGPNAISRHSGSTPVKGIEVPDMEFPIPSDVTAFDSDGDTFIDRLYVGDTGGQMWRVDFSPNRGPGTANIGLIGVVGKLATVSFDNLDTDNLADAPADERKFFYPPSVLRVRGIGSFATQDYDLVSAVTGNRANPLNLAVRDRFYAFRDFNTVYMADTDGNGLADSYTPIQGDLDGDPDANPPINPKTFSEMVDFTVLDGPDDLTDPNDFITSSGYFLRLDTGGAGNGEKGLAAPTTLSGKLFFTTYLPQAVVDTDKCTLAEGRGQLYGIDPISGSAIFTWDNPGDPTINRQDRIYTLGSGIPSSPVPVFFPEKVSLLVGVGGGAKAIDPDIGIPRWRTYWFEQ